MAASTRIDRPDVSSSSGTPDDDDNPDDEREDENEAPVRERNDRTEAPEEFDVDDEDELSESGATPRIEREE